MTGISERRNNNLTPATSVRIDSADPAKLLGSSGVATTSRQKFWASVPRSINSKTEEVLEVSFGSPRTINLLSFQIARFPCTMRVEWLDEDDNWQPFNYALETIQIRTPNPTREPFMAQPVGLSIAESVPAVVNTAQAKGHPQHFGNRHWRSEEWKVVPATTAKVRFVLKRNPIGTAPQSPSGHKVEYSLALQQIRVGYRVASESDLPPGPDDLPWESSRDILDSTVYYSLYRQSASRAIDGDRNTSWRSEPQPVNYAVVPFFLDMRDDEGQGQVVDRFWVDPATAGVHCNLYFTDDEPSGDFFGDDREVPYRFRDEQGIATLDKGQIVFGADAPSGVGVSKVFARVDGSKGWWVGLDATVTAATSDTSIRPIVSIGGNQIVQQGGAIRFLGQAGEDVALPLDDSHVVGARYRLVVSHHPAVPGRGEHIRIVYLSHGWGLPNAIENGVIVPKITSGVRVGLHPDPDSTNVSALAVRALVVKDEVLDLDTEKWFLDEGEAYVRDDQTYGLLDRHTNTNAVLRMHPVFVSASNQYGVVGGDGDRLRRSTVWHPINRDYVLNRGYIEFPPVRAKYWKFEFTQLAPRLFESFQTLDRTVLCFPPDVVRQFSEVGPQPVRDFRAHGIETMVSGRISSSDLYADALDALRRSGAGVVNPEATQALVITQPQLAQQAAETGWIWQYQPWHTGATSPRWVEPGVHYYERIPVKHTSKVAYFVGLNEVVPYRTVFSQPDDTDEYVERFYDDRHIAEIKDAVRDPLAVVATSTTAVVTSTTYSSFLNVRGLQFATMETGPVQVLKDPDFALPLDLNYRPYGDATVTRLAKNTVEVERGWSGQTYASLEEFTYGELEAFTYFELEGRTSASDTGSDSEDGGVETLDTYRPMGAGGVTAKVKVSTKTPLTFPIRVEILGSDDTVLASSQKIIAPGATTTMSAVFTSLNLMGFRTYAELEHLTAGDLGAGSEFEVGPATTSSASPTLLTPHQISTTQHHTYTPNTGLQYRIEPTESGTISIDTLLSGVEPDLTQPPGFTTLIFATSGLTNITATPGQVIGDVTAGTPVVISVVYWISDGAGGYTSPPATIRVRTSEINDTTLWDAPPVDTTIEDTLYSDLEQFTYGELESSSSNVTQDLRVRVRQEGGDRDVFRVHRIALYDDPVRWSFSVDDGETWFPAIGVKNNPMGAMLFPVPGKALRWKAEIYRPDASISSIHIRPWYGTGPSHSPAFFDLEQTGPNQSGWDLYPTLPQHPMWKPVKEVEFDLLPPKPDEPFWRNLVPNPGGEGVYLAQFENVIGGTIETQYDGG